MAELISALGILLAGYLAFPQRKVASVDAKKSKIAKALFSLVSRLDPILSRGHEILDALRQVAEASDKSEFVTRKKRLFILLSCQLDEIRELASLAKHNLWDIHSYFRFSPKSEDVLHVGDVLRVYEPDLGRNFTMVVDLKSENLTTMLEFFKSQASRLRIGEMRILELVSLGKLKECPSWFGMPKDWIEKAIEEGALQTRSIDLSDREEREQYLNGAAERLTDLQAARQKLAALIAKHYEPHHFL